jgi:hypothetical protein
VCVAVVGAGGRARLGQQQEQQNHNLLPMPVHKQLQNSKGDGTRGKPSAADGCTQSRVPGTTHIHTWPALLSYTPSPLENTKFISKAFSGMVTRVE